MIKLWMSLCQRQLLGGDYFRLSDGHHGVFVLGGELQLNGQGVSAGDGVYSQVGDVSTKAGAEVLQFSLTVTPAEGALQAEQIVWPDVDCVFRLDQVSFPPGARAYRHTHPGPGFRCLTEGALEIKSDDHAEMMSPLNVWFEAANSPVQATAGGAPTAFVRAMMLPMDYLERPTLHILDPADRAKPRLQTNRRFFDQVVRLPVG